MKERYDTITLKYREFGRYTMTQDNPDGEHRQAFADWLNEQLRQRGWTQGKLIAQSGASDEERLSSAAVSRYSTGKMLPDAASCQKIARVFGLPVDVVLRKAGLIDPLPEEVDWVQRAIDDLVYAVEAGQLSREGQIAIVAHIRREQRLQELEHQKQISAS
jgi:transcriptional regulator with XRE-family HTH domain